MKDRTLGHYRILETLGSGGMGVVYRARDERLQRDVALKVLVRDRQAAEAGRPRFRQEALALSRINHPSIATVFDFDSVGDTDFLVMELIGGATLAEKLAGGPLPEREVRRIGLQLGEGLAAAHEAGVIHRDLKPRNVQVAPDGRLKILDFGIATLRRLPEPDETSATGPIVDSGPVYGTPPYVAPEQLLDDCADARCDLHALGAILYEAATGIRPFAGISGPRLTAAILHQAPKPPRQLNPSVSPALEQIIVKAMDKDPGRRYQSARELLVDLLRLDGSSTLEALPVTVPLAPARRRLAWGTMAAVILVTVLLGGGSGAGARSVRLSMLGPIESLAVLPLENRSEDPGQEFFADGMTDALIADLGRIGSLKVISRTSAMQFKGVKKSLPEIGRELGVDAVVEGSVFRSGNRVRVTAQLIHAPSDRLLWSDTYEREIKDVLALQGEMVATIAQEVKAKVTPENRELLSSRKPVDPEAYEAYLRGKQALNQSTEDSSRKAIDYFQQALRREPGYAPAYAALADAYVVLGEMAGEPGPFVTARAAAAKAVELDPQLGEGHSQVAYANILNRDWTAAEVEFKQALALSPGSSAVHQEYAWYLAARGRLDEALAEMRLARDLDPLSPLANAGVAGILMYRREPEAAVEQLRRVMEHEPDFLVAQYGLGRVYLLQGKHAQAIAQFEKVVGLAGSWPAASANLACAHALAGHRREALKALERWEKLIKSGFPEYQDGVCAYAALGQKDKAFSLLDKAYANHARGMVWLKVDPGMDQLRSDPRFQDLLQRLGLAG